MKLNNDKKSVQDDDDHDHGHEFRRHNYNFAPPISSPIQSSSVFLHFNNNGNSIGNDYDDERDSYTYSQTHNINNVQQHQNNIQFDDSSSSSSLDDLDVQGISLLGVIFPDASREELEELHFQRVETVSKLNNNADGCSENDHEKYLYKDYDENYNKNHGDDVDKDKFINGDQDFVSSSKSLNNDDEDFIIDNTGTSSEEIIDCDKLHGKEYHKLQNRTTSPKKSLLSPSLSSSLVLSPSSSFPLTSPLGKRILQKSSNPNNPKYNDLKNCLSDDFLRVPSNQIDSQHNYNEINTIRKGDSLDTSSYRQQQQTSNGFNTHPLFHNNISQLEANVKFTMFGANGFNESLQSSNCKASITSVTLYRDMYVGLGLQLCEWNGCIYVNALICHNGKIISSVEMYQNAIEAKSVNNSSSDSQGPAFHAGIRPGDRILGVNGNAFVKNNNDEQSFNSGNTEIQENSASLPSTSSSQALIFAVKMIAEARDPVILHIMRYETDKSKENFFCANDGLSQNIISANNSGTMKKDPLPQSSYLPNYVHPFSVCLSKNGIIKHNDEMKLSKLLTKYTNRALIWESNAYLKQFVMNKDNIMEMRNGKTDGYPGLRVNRSLSYQLTNHAFDLSIVRQALCISIVNAFVDGDRLAFTIWVYDVEAQKDWYAPIRYFQDFKDLRLAISRLYKGVDKFPFPSFRWYHESEASSSQSFKEARCYELELFLKCLCTMIYKETIEKSCIVEVALYIQTFLACDAHLHVQTNDSLMEHNPQKMQTLKCAVQLYTFRLFLLPSMDILLSNFVDGVKKRIMVFEKYKIVSKTSDLSEKERILSELSSINHFYSALMKLIHDGCSMDLKLIATNTGYSSSKSESDLLKSAIREQVEVHAYVPLRSALSRLLVFGWRYDDKEFYFKRQILLRKDQSFFKIKKDYQSPSQWQSVVNILNQEVGQSTLPCLKLRAIVSAGKEVERLFKTESSVRNHLGADNFLPIFIFCVVRADIERPYALSILLRSLCDENQSLGATGYYLSSFEAAITYVHELDLSTCE